MASNALLLDKVAKCIRRLGDRFKENALFVSQRFDNDVDKATVIIGMVGNKKDSDEAYLHLRRLLMALKYRVNKDTEFELDFNLKRKE